MRDDDVVMSSLPKGGTTWAQKILYLLLKGMDQDGRPIKSESIGSASQVYPESLVMRRGDPADPESSLPDVRVQYFGDWGFEDMCGQPSPRLFSTHLYGSYLPEQLRDASKIKGRLIVVLRNLKDVCVSLHFFRGEPKDGWLGNEHGPGSFARFIDPDCLNAYGSSFEFIKQNDELVASLAETGRALILYYEDMQRNLAAQVGRIAEFLRVPLSDAKRDAIVQASSFDSMKSTSGLSNVVLRKGGIGDWQNHLSTTEWSRFDDIFEKTLGNVQLAVPLRFYQEGQIAGIPPPRKDHTWSNDPRTWGSFVRKTLIDGRVVPDEIVSKMDGTTFKRPLSQYTGVVMPPGTPGGKHTAEDGRYHIFVSGVCPWASGVRAARHILGLDDVISMDVADGQSGAGWAFVTGSGCPPWNERGEKPFFLHEAYQASDPFATTPITVPVLWDKKLECVVSSDSWTIVKMLGTAFESLGQNSIFSNAVAPCKRNASGDFNCDAIFVPPSLAAEMEAVHKQIYDKLLNGVYRCAISRMKGNKEAGEVAEKDVYAMLDELDTRLKTRRFLLGTQLPTAVDIRLTMTLLRYDFAYRPAFGLQGGKGGILVGQGPDDAPGYPVLCEYVRDMYAFVKPSVDWTSFSQYYRLGRCHPATEPLPDLRRIEDSAKKPHHRDEMF